MIEFGFRQLKDPHEVLFSPTYHWTDHTIAVHTSTRVLSLQLTLGGIGETVLIYPSIGSRPKARSGSCHARVVGDRLHVGGRVVGRHDKTSESIEIECDRAWAVPSRPTRCGCDEFRRTTNGRCNRSLGS